MEFFQRILSKRHNRIFLSSFISVSKFHFYLFLFFQFSIQFIVFKIFRNFECLIPSIGILHKSEVRIKINIFTLSGKRKSSNFLLILILDRFKNLKSFLQDYTWLGVKKNLLREQTCSLARDRGGERGGGARLHRETIPYKFAGNHTLSYSRRSLSRDGRCFVHGAERLISITRFDWKGLYIRMTRRWLISVYAKLCRHVAADVRASLLVSPTRRACGKSVESRR